MTSSVKHIGYTIQAVKGNTFVPGLSSYGGEYEWTTWDNAEVYRTKREAFAEIRQIPKDNWPEGAEKLVVMEAYA